MMSRQSTVWMALSILFVTGCVPMSQFAEVRDDRDALDQDLETLTQQVEALRLAVAEKDGQAREDARKMEALAADTARCGTALRSCGARNAELEALNAMLTEELERKRSASGAEQAALLSELQRIRADLQFQEDSLLALDRDLRDREARVAELTRLLEAQKSAGEALKTKLNDALFAFRNRGLEVEERDGKVYVRLASKLLFASGSTAIDPEGRNALIGLARAIEGETGFEIVVEGHTDDVAFNSSTSPKNNWELSVLRSTAVVEVLTANSGLDPAQLTAAGRSEFHPRDPEDRNRNRRIEVVLSPKLDGLYDLLEE
ncbi:MAG: OmpA family protein [Bacteroidota bacterium]|nr:OmpA family protein [Bacteroidota bacterium]MEC8597820.1 OmpA family protein [Bacteroidota bacterium]